MIKILFTSVGRRVELMQAFRQAAEHLGTKVELWGADVTQTAPALLFCDKKVQVCKIKEPEYIPQLYDLCKQNGIDLLIPTIDTDLLVLSENKEMFKAIGTTILVSDIDKIAVCRDKRLTAEYFHSVGLKSPKPVDDYLKYDSKYPAFIKPKDGSSSVFAYKVNSLEELKTYAGQVPDYIVQPYIKGTEYTVDVLCDFDGNPIFITPRIRLAVRSGEVLKTEIAQDDKIIEEIKQLIGDYKPCGQITVQMIREEISGDDYYIEINPRFGGGAPLTMKAGADSAEAVIRLALGEKLQYCQYAAENGAVFSRFDQSVRVK